jgi:RNA polymerase sigma-70 factor (ECF subfamily)
MVAFKEGDPEAFATLYDRHARALINFFYKMCYDRALAEDLTQDTFLKILRHRGNYRPEATFKTFLYAVAKNLWIDRYRSQKTAPKTVSTEIRAQEEGATLGELVQAAADSPVERLAGREAADLVRDALLKLPDAQRLVFVMAEAQGLKYREIAQILDVPVGTVKSRMNAAVTTLRGLLGRVLQ